MKQSLLSIGDKRGPLNYNLALRKRFSNPQLEFTSFKEVVLNLGMGLTGSQPGRCARRKEEGGRRKDGDGGVQTAPPVQTTAFWQKHASVSDENKSEREKLFLRHV